MDRKISYTKIKTFNVCPLKWFLHYYVGLYKIEHNFSTVVGFLTHFFIENYVKTVMYEKKYNLSFKNDDFRYVVLDDDKSNLKFITFKDKKSLFKKYSKFCSKTGTYVFDTTTLKNDLGFMNKRNIDSLIDFIDNYNGLNNDGNIILLNTSLKWFNNTVGFINELVKRSYNLLSEYEINVNINLDDNFSYVLNTNIDLCFKDNNKIYVIDFKTNKLNDGYDYKQLLLYAYSIQNSSLNQNNDIKDFYLGFYNPRYSTMFDSFLKNIKGIKLDKVYLDNLINKTFINFLNGYYKFNVNLHKKFSYIDTANLKINCVVNNTLFNIDYVVKDFIKYIKDKNYDSVYNAILSNYNDYKNGKINSVCNFCQYRSICHRVFE